MAAWVIGTRNTLKALLKALVEPIARLRECEAAADYTARLALQEEIKGLPWGAVWDHYCATSSVGVGHGVARSGARLREPRAVGARVSRIVRRWAPALLVALMILWRGGVQLRTASDRIGVQPRSNGSAIADVQRLFAEPPDDSRIMMRWWWFGPSATREELDARDAPHEGGRHRRLRGCRRLPAGAWTIPRAAFTTTRISRPEFLDRDRVHRRADARELGLRMDLTIGSGWSYGGPYITPGLAASAAAAPNGASSRPDVTSIERPAPFEHDRLIAAFIAPGSVQEADPASFRELTIPETGRIAAAAGTRSARRAVLLCRPDRPDREARRAGRGRLRARSLQPRGDRDASARGGRQDARGGRSGQHQLRSSATASRSTTATGRPICSMNSRRAADTTCGRCSRSQNSAPATRRRLVRRDYGQHAHRAVRESAFSLPVHEWAAKHGVRFRIQNYGMPPASLASYRHADIFDGEGFEWRTLSAIALGLVGVAPLRQTRHFVGNMDVAALARVPRDAARSARRRPTSTFSPASTSSSATAGRTRRQRRRRPAGCSMPPAPTPTRIPWWPVMPDTARVSAARRAFVLRQGEPVADVALYAPTDDAWSQFRPGNARVSEPLQRAFTICWRQKIVPAILDAGHAFDLIDDGSMAEARRATLSADPAAGREEDAGRHEARTRR